MSRISSVAYAFEDNGSLQNTGNASFFGSNVSPSRSLRNGRPTNNRFGNSNTFTAPDNPGVALDTPDLDAALTPAPPILTPP